MLRRGQTAAMQGESDNAVEITSTLSSQYFSLMTLAETVASGGKRCSSRRLTRCVSTKPCRKLQLRPKQVSKRRRHAIDGKAVVFAGGKLSVPNEAKIKELHAKIGRLAVGNFVFRGHKRPARFAQSSPEFGMYDHWNTLQNIQNELSYDPAFCGRPQGAT